MTLERRSIYPSPPTVACCEGVDTSSTCLWSRWVQVRRRSSAAFEARQGVDERPRGVSLATDATPPCPLLNTEVLAG